MNKDIRFSMMRGGLLRLLIVAISFTAASTRVSAEETSGEAPGETYDIPAWLKVYYRSGGVDRLERIPYAEADTLFFDARYNDPDLFGRPREKEAPEGVTALNIRLHDGTAFRWGLDSVTGVRIGGDIPTVSITTDPWVEELEEKETYLKGEFQYVPYGCGYGTDTVASSVSVKGRGNSSWYYPKKPYRLKFDKKQQIGRLPKAKSFVLIANYIDNSLMKNAVAFEIARLLEMPFTNISEPVNLVFNGRDRGSYMLTNKVGINSGSVDIDEMEGILWEIDDYYDEHYRFRPAPYGLPCMVKDPDFLEIAEGSAALEKGMWQYWQRDLEQAFQAVADGRWTDAFDFEQFVRYFLVNDLVQNDELGYPKSMYLYKERHGEKYKLGPVWDFDWAMGYAFYTERNLIYKDQNSYGFLYPILSDPQFLARFKELFEEFKEVHLPALMEFIDAYAALIRDSAMIDAEIWPEAHRLPGVETGVINTERFDENVKWIKEWLVTRIEYIGRHPNFALF